MKETHLLRKFRMQTLLGQDAANLAMIGARCWSHLKLPGARGKALLGARSLFAHLALPLRAVVFWLHAL